MAPTQEELQALWHPAPPGKLTPWQQALALGLREASKEVYEGHICVTWIASKLRKTDNIGKAYSEDAPAHGSVSEFLDKVNNDPEWFPGKHNGVRRGPQPRLTKSKRRRIAASALRP